MFRITVEEVKEVEKLEKEYQRISDKNEGEYGYVQTRNNVSVSNNIYTQEVSNLDLVSVINAVNKAEVKEKK